MKVKRAERYGFCAGVRLADRKVRRFLAAGGRGAVLGPLVHNERMVAEMEALGLVTIDHLDQAGDRTVVFSAHGVPPSLHRRARQLRLTVLDTTCTFVRDIHRESRAALAEGDHLVFLGHPGHREVIGYCHDLPSTSHHVVTTLEQARAVDWSRYPKIRVFFQTTLNAADFIAVVDWIRRCNPATVEADTVCYATRENQEAARRLADDPEVEAVLVIGGARSANTRHLWEIAARRKRAYLIQGREDVAADWLEGLRCVGLTAGASTPDALMDEVERLVEGM